MFLSLSPFHPLPNSGKMSKSAFKLQAINLHISDYSINLPSVFHPHQSTAMTSFGISRVCVKRQRYK